MIQTAQKLLIQMLAIQKPPLYAHTMWMPTGMGFATIAPIMGHAAIIQMPMEMGFVITARIMGAAIAEAMQTPTEMGFAITIPEVAAAKAMGAIMAVGIMEGATTGRENEGDILCAASRRLSRQ